MSLVNTTVDLSTPPNVLAEARPCYRKVRRILLPEFSHTLDEFALQPEAFERLITSYCDAGVATILSTCTHRCPWSRAWA